MEYGIKETKEVLDMGIAAVAAYRGAMADGRIDLNDLAHLIPLAGVVGPAIEGIEKVPAELQDLTKEEHEELKAHLDGKLGNGAWDKVGVEIFKAGLHLARALTIFKKAAA